MNFVEIGIIFNYQHEAKSQEIPVKALPAQGAKAPAAAGVVPKDW